MATEKSAKVDQIPVGNVPDTGRVVDERWFVEEYFPPRIDPTTGMALGESWNRNYNEPFATESEANSWIAKHQPDFEGGKFRKAHEVLREVTTTQWMPA
jgi:hypothetical protein